MLLFVALKNKKRNTHTFTLISSVQAKVSMVLTMLYPLGSFHFKDVVSQSENAFA